jgi:hypothetical protein
MARNDLEEGLERWYIRLHGLVWAVAGTVAHEPGSGMKSRSNSNQYESFSVANQKNSRGQSREQSCRHVDRN